MKKKIGIAACFFLFFFLITTVFPVLADPFVLVLDAGHGGKDHGATGKKIKAKEKDIVLAVSLLAGKYISEQHPDVKVVYTRKTDTFLKLYERTGIANKAQADLFISVHTNAANVTSPRGLEVYAFGVSRTAENLEVAKRENSVIYLEDNYQERYENFDPNAPESYIIFEFIQNKFVEQSLDFASMLHKELKRCTSWPDRGVKQAAFYVLREVSMPRVLIELDFISNAGAEALMASEAGQKKYAKAICNAFGKYKADYDRKNGIRQTVPPVKKTEETVDTSPVEKKEKAGTNNRIYKVQIMAVPRKLPPNSSHLKGQKASYFVENKLYKYTCGESGNLEEITRLRRSLQKDFKDAFIVAFEDGVKVEILK